MKKRSKVLIALLSFMIVISIIAVTAASIAIGYKIHNLGEEIPKTVHKEANSYLDKVKEGVEDKINDEEALKNTFNYISEYSKYEGKVSELQYLYETGVLSENKVRKALKSIVLEANSDPDIHNISIKDYKDIDTKDIRLLLKNIIRDLDDASDHSIFFYETTDN